MQSNDYKKCRKTYIKKEHGTMTLPNVIVPCSFFKAVSDLRYCCDIPWTR